MSVLDVGARWGAKKAWYNLAPFSQVVGFEPDPDECARLTAAKGVGEQFFPFALGARNARAILHVTREPGCSSLYPPDEVLAQRYPALHVITPVKDLEVDLVTLDHWAHGSVVPPIVFMKLDVQGAELDVLSGGERVLEGCVGLEVEVEFSPLYQGQPLFADVDTLLRKLGFTLWRLSHLVHYGEQPLGALERKETAAYSNIHTEFAAGAGRLFWGHALYFRDYRNIPAGRSGLVQNLALAALLDAAKEVDGRNAALGHLSANFAFELGASGAGLLRDYLEK